MSVLIPNRTVEICPVRSAREIGWLCDYADLPERERYTLDEVAELLYACGYAVTPGVILEFQRKNYIGEPPAGLWTPPFILALTRMLDERRRWLPVPNELHDHKKSIVRVQMEERPMVFSDLGEHTLEDLLLRITKSDERHLREVYFEAILAKLDAVGFIEE